MQLLPLVIHDSPDNIIAWKNNSAITRNQFLADVEQLASLLPANDYVLNVCSDRYHFSVGVAAAMVTGKISMLPPTITTTMIQQLSIFAPDVFCLTDSDACIINLPQLRYPTQAAQANTELAIPQIASDLCAAIVFTSGSTGAPLPHNKSWGALVNSVQAEALRLGLTSKSEPCTLTGTVPPQHMYGFESTVLMAWQSGCALNAAQPFYPADICQALENTPNPRVLISSPVHLRALVDSELVVPEVTFVVSATAPLSESLVHKIEQHCKAPLTEIYGCTETGLIATRRASQSLSWQLLPEIALSFEADKAYASGGHIPEKTAMSDTIEPLANGSFLMHGRLADMVNIAGKRHSIASLNHLLNSIPGVKDGVFYMPDETSNTRVTRLAAIVVAPNMTKAELLKALRKHIEPVFLPRPLLLVEALPRNNSGKLPRTTLQALLNQASDLREAF